MTKRKTWIVFGFLVGVALMVAACGAGSDASEGGTTGGDFPKNADGYADISVEQLADKLESRDLSGDGTQDFVLVNTHIPYEGDIPGTDLSIPFDQVPDYVDQLPDKDAEIVLYCRSGSMSTSAAKELVGMGYSNVLELDGGFNAWKAAGYEMVE
jgi:rhodanese-related sulfurtransferase